MGWLTRVFLLMICHSDPAFPPEYRRRSPVLLAREHFNLPRFPGGLPGREGAVP